MIHCAKCGDVAERSEGLRAWICSQGHGMLLTDLQIANEPKWAEYVASQVGSLGVYFQEKP